MSKLSITTGSKSAVAKSFASPLKMSSKLLISELTDSHLTAAVIGFVGAGGEIDLYKLIVGEVHRRRCANERVE